MTATPKFGRVNSDKEAFQKVLERLQGDVGQLKDLVKHFNNNSSNEQKKILPFWAFTRMLFPIAESMGDLIYQNNSTVKNLTDVLEKEFQSVRPFYKGTANIIAFLFRHSLTHTDEMRTLIYKKTKVYWKLSFYNQNRHLSLEKTTDGFMLFFDLVAFYEDIEKVCKKAIASASTAYGKIANRYNNWLELKFDDNKSSHKKAVAEIIRLAFAIKSTSVFLNKTG